jgi:DNA repair exonuclease SbcCD ATPase subunit
MGRITLRAIIAAQQAEIHKLTSSARAYEALIEALQIQITRLKKQKFGASSEKITREIEQLELALEGLDIERAAADPNPEEPDDEPASASTERPSLRRRGKPRLTGDVIRERIVLDPGNCCPDCGGARCGWSARTCPRSSTSSRPSSSWSRRHG